MAYYITAREASPFRQDRICWAAGPFNRHGDALALVDDVRRLVESLGYADAYWHVYGTTHLKAGPLPAGRFNADLGLPCGPGAERIRSLEEDLWR